MYAPWDHIRAIGSWKELPAGLFSELGTVVISSSGRISKRSYCHGRFVLWGDTSNHPPVSGLYRRWEISSRTFSAMAGEWVCCKTKRVCLERRRREGGELFRAQDLGGSGRDIARYVSRGAPASKRLIRGGARKRPVRRNIQHPCRWLHRAIYGEPLTVGWLRRHRSAVSTYGFLATGVSQPRTFQLGTYRPSSTSSTQKKAPTKSCRGLNAKASCLALSAGRDFLDDYVTPGLCKSPGKHRMNGRMVQGYLPRSDLHIQWSGPSSRHQLFKRRLFHPNQQPSQSFCIEIPA